MRWIYRKWGILFLMTLTIFTALGFGRFSFGALLPFIQKNLSFNYQEIGWITSSVFLGYWISSTFSGYVVLRFSAKHVITFSLGVMILGMLGIANTSHFTWMYFFCLWMGIGIGGINIPALGYVSQSFPSKMRGKVIGISNAGIGVGMILSGIGIPLIMSHYGEESWRKVWIIYVVISVFILIFNVLFLNPSPQAEKVSNEEEMPLSLPYQEKKKMYTNRWLWILGGSYMLWGLSYLNFSTFLVDYLMQDIGWDKKIAGYFFSLLGISSIVSGFIWGMISDIVGRIRTLMMVYFLQTFLLLLFAFFQSFTVILLVTFLYGMTLWAVPTLMMAIIPDYFSESDIPIAMGMVSFFFCAGQFFSPIVTGFLVDATHSYLYAYLFSSVTCFIAGGLLSGWKHKK